MILQNWWQDLSQQNTINCEKWMSRSLCVCVEHNYPPSQFKMWLCLSVCIFNFFFFRGIGTRWPYNGSIGLILHSFVGTHLLNYELWKQSNYCQRVPTPPKKYDFESNFCQKSPKLQLFDDFLRDFQLHNNFSCFQIFCAKKTIKIFLGKKN